MIPFGLAAGSLMGGRSTLPLLALIAGGALAVAIVARVYAAGSASAEAHARAASVEHANQRLSAALSQAERAREVSVRAQDEIAALGARAAREKANRERLAQELREERANTPPAPGRLEVVRCPANERESALLLSCPLLPLP